MNRVPFAAAVTAFLYLGLASAANPATVLVLQFHNSSQYPDLNWVGESVAETLKDEFSAQNEIVFGREARTEALHRLSLRPGADYTKATLIRLGQSLDADYVCYGTYDSMLPAGSSELKNSSIQVSAHFIDLRKLHDGPDLAEAGKLADLSRLEEHLAWQSLRFIDPSLQLPLERFMSPEKLTRVDADESYIRGLLSSSKEQQQKWFAQALALDPRFTSAAYELGRLSLERKDYRQAISWLQRISASDWRYPEARFKMGLAAYEVSDYPASAGYFREVAKMFPLNEVYNNLGAAEDQMNQPNAMDDFRRALDGDPADPIYLFNLGNALLRRNSFDEATQRLQAAVNHDPENTEARNLLSRAQRKELNTSGNKPLAADRLKVNFEISAFRQLKAVVQPRSNP
ncbi:MAG: tetratricopeptide repeat protein [Acidobacteriota bacterium]|nr:tetratricopeptide repeat protein [Acidobacteriota bacterium]